MDRLTGYNDFGGVYAIDLGVGYDPDIVNKVLRKLAAYEDAEEQGRLIVLPCKAGDTVYQLRGKQHIKGVGISPRHISCVTVWGDDWAAYHQGATPCFKGDLGIAWFLSYEAAEKALNERGER